jgi:ubiquinone/menaquinone biosynthesis C-methylase UbiE
LKDTYSQLLEESLPPEGHPQRELWREYALSGEQRAQDSLDYIERVMPVGGLLLLDIGCGDGGLTVATRKRGCHVVAVDSSAAALRRAQARISARGMSTCLIQGCGLKLPLESNSFDIVVLQDVIEHVPDPLLLVKEAFRVTRMGGLCYISAANPHFIGHILSDPHWGLFGVSLMPHWLGKLYVCLIRKMCKTYDVWHLPSHGMIRKWLRAAGFWYVQDLHPGQELFRHLTTDVFRAIGRKHGRP